jgi:hypothetical protein
MMHWLSTCWRVMLKSLRAMQTIQSAQGPSCLDAHLATCKEETRIQGEGPPASALHILRASIEGAQSSQCSICSQHLKSVILNTCSQFVRLRHFSSFKPKSYSSAKIPLLTNLTTSTVKSWIGKPMTLKEQPLILFTKEPAAPWIPYDPAFPNGSPEAT